jgi:hypothetical protein
MPVAVSCSCGKNFSVKDDLAGKKIKCPGCQAVVQVPAAQPGPIKASALDDEDPPPPKRLKKPARSADDDFDDEPRGERGGKKKKGSKTTLFVLLGCGVVTLGLCCIGGSVGGYFLFLAGPGDPEKEIVGTWRHDGFKGDKGKGFVLDETLEFKEDGTYIPKYPKATLMTYTNGKWKVITKTGNSISVELTFDRVIGTSTSNIKETKKLTFVSHNELHMDLAGGQASRYKRVP